MSETFSTFLGTDSLLVGTLVPFLFVLTIVVFVHEMGHYLVGRWCGIGVKAFSIGFGPEIFGFNDRRGTRWKLSAIPLGGYVKFVGDMNATSTLRPKASSPLLVAAPSHRTSPLRTRWPIFTNGFWFWQVRSLRPANFVSGYLRPSTSITSAST